MSEPQVLHALQQKWIRHAVLDVFETEPLPPSSALWEHDSVSADPYCHET